MGNLMKPTLVLNKSWTPVHVTTVRDAICKACMGIVDVLNDDYIRHTWEDWALLDIVDEGYAVRTSHNRVNGPKVVVLSKYNKIPVFEVHMTRKNLWIRDGFSCQYTGQRLKLKEATIDHIVPQSKGGTSSWLNVVICDRTVNRRKGDRTPEEAGLKLIRQPYAPSWNPLFTGSASVANPPEVWSNFMKQA